MPATEKKVYFLHTGAMRMESYDKEAAAQVGPSI